MSRGKLSKRNERAGNEVPDYHDQVQQYPQYHSATSSSFHKPLIGAVHYNAPHSTNTNTGPSASYTIQQDLHLQGHRFPLPDPNYKHYYGHKDDPFLYDAYPSTSVHPSVRHDPAHLLGDSSNQNHHVSRSVIPEHAYLHMVPNQPPPFHLNQGMSSSVSTEGNYNLLQPPPSRNQLQNQESLESNEYLKAGNEFEADPDLQRLLSKQAQNIPKQKEGKWSREEDEKLSHLARLREKNKKYRRVKWKTIAASMGGGKDAGACQRRWNKVIYPGLSKGHWSETEDNILREKAEAFVNSGKKIQWWKVASFIEGRIGKQCRERWENKLRPGLRHEEWTDEEDILCLQAYLQHGKKWKQIANCVPGRSENTVKNRIRSERFWQLPHIKQFQEPTEVKEKESTDKKEKISTKLSSTELVKKSEKSSSELVHESEKNL